MKYNPFVSILVPIYNAEPYISRCLDSILGQKYSNLQIVLIDDGSTDNSFDICQKYAERDSRIELYCQQNQGVSVTRNKLLDKVRGDYVLFVDADDWIEHDMIESLIDLAVCHKGDIVTCQNVVNDSLCNKEKELDLWSQEEAIYHFLRHEIFNGALWNKLIRAQLLNGIKFHPDISFGEDALFCWYVLQRVKKVVRTEAQYYHYRMNVDSISHQQYGEKRMSGHLVWKCISSDTKINWPQYSMIANASFAISDMWQLYYAAADGYKYDGTIKKFQSHVRKNMGLIAKTRMINFKKYIFAIVASLNYNAAKLLLRKIK